MATLLITKNGQIIAKNKTQMTFNELYISEFESTFALLRESKLDPSDLKQDHIRLFQFQEEEQVFGIGGLEVFGNLALLRSVAVKPDVRGKGIGKELVAQIEQVAKHSGIKALYLLTNTAPDFFKSIGYQQIHREDFAEPLKQTSQFSGLCPVSAICMKKEFNSSIKS
jgi:amino-acid N-acetyltransferase